MKTDPKQSGFIMLLALVMAIVLSALGMIAAQVLISNAQFQQYEHHSSQAMDVAESGINYYLWHLSHNSSDFKDGGATPAAAPFGPYVHNSYDTDGSLLGTYTLWITPPVAGSTITTVKSIGQVPHFSGTRTILAQLGQPSFANYALLTGTEVWFGTNESSNGPVHSNVGVHMDGTNNGTVTSGSATYKPTSSFGGDGGTHNGVWGTGGPTSQWQFPVPVIDFSKVTADYSSCQTQATASGISLPATGKLGYYLKLKSNGTIDEYIVKTETSSGFTTTTASPIANLAAPANGIIYAADDVWVEGTGYPGKINILSGVLPDNAATNTSITIVGNLTYAAKDGSAVVGLIAQNNVGIAEYAPNTLEVDAALLAQKGHVWFPGTGPAKSGALTFYGSIDSFDFWTWSWTSGGTLSAGYGTNSNTFDTNLTYGPPPCYPTTGTFAVLNWREQLFNP